MTDYSVIFYFLFKFRHHVAHVCRHHLLLQAAAERVSQDWSCHIICRKYNPPLWSKVDEVIACIDLNNALYRIVVCGVQGYVVDNIFSCILLADLSGITREREQERDEECYKCFFHSRSSCIELLYVEKRRSVRRTLPSDTSFLTYQRFDYLTILMPEQLNQV